MTRLTRAAGTARAYLLGWNIAYSASPAMHAAGYRQLNLDWTYELLDVPPERLAETLDSMRVPPVAGANVTIPHKMAVIRYLDELSGEAARAGSVNTLVREGSRLIGYNTDVVGIRRALQQVGVGDPRGARAVVFGAGGSARAALVALEGAEVVLVARKPDQAPERLQVLAWDDPEWRRLSRAADVVVNATPLGRGGENLLDPGALPVRGGVVDLVYVAGGTPLVRAAREQGLATTDGWDVLVWQGAASFQIWTGLEPPEAAMRAALGA